MESEKLNQLKKANSAFVTLIKVFEWIDVIGAVLFAVLMIVTTNYDLRVSGLKFSVFGTDTSKAAGSIFIHVIILIVGVVILALIFLVLKYIEKTFKDMADSDSPFNDENYRRLKVMAIVVTVISFLSLNLILAIIILLTFICFMRLFAYGCELQKLSDETL